MKTALCRFWATLWSSYCLSSISMNVVLNVLFDVKHDSMLCTMMSNSWTRHYQTVHSSAHYKQEQLQPQTITEPSEHQSCFACADVTAGIWRCLQRWVIQTLSNLSAFEQSGSLLLFWHSSHTNYIRQYQHFICSKCQQTASQRSA